MINNENYYNAENSVKFMSASQFKSFMECESKALAEIKGEYQRETTTALLVGSYVDAWFEGTLDKFKENHSAIFLKSGGLKADYVQADEIIKRVSSDEQFMKYMSGKKQVIFTGNIAGVPFKGKLDSYHIGKCIVDLKTVRDFEPIWKNGRKMSFVEAWGYDIQGAVYQELVYQATGQKLPFVICAVTKEKVPDIAIISIPQERLDFCLEIVKSKAPRFQEIKSGTLIPERCEKCSYCRITKKLDGVIDYRDLNPELFKYETSEPEEKSPVTVRSIAENISDIPEEKPLEKPKKKHKKHKKHKEHKKDNNVIIIKI